MSYRFKEPGHGPDGPREGGRMMSGMDSDKLPREEMDELGRGSRPPFNRGRRPSPGRDKGFMDRSRDFGGFGRDDMPSSRDRDRSPLRGGYDDRYPERDRFKRDEIMYRGRDDLSRKEPPRPFMDDRDPFREKYMDSRGRYDMGFNPRYEMPEDQYKHRAMNYSSIPPKTYYKNDMMKPNECEIIVVNKQQRAYAENIEARMKNLGIQVDILFLKDEALLVQTIDDIARRGSLYAMVVSPLNETHGSVTLNILYGTPQEHRNMPLDDALKLVARNFHDHIRSQREIMDRDKSERGFYFGSFPADREIQFLLRLLADGRQLSIGELDTVIKYLTERRDRMKNPQGEPNIPSASSHAIPSDGPITQKNIKDDIDMAQKEQDLQNRIMNIMNQGSGGESAGAPLMQNKPPIGMNVPGIQGDIPGPRQSMSPGIGGGQNRPPVSQNQSHLGTLPPGGTQPGMSGPEQSGPASRGGLNVNQMAGQGTTTGSKTPTSSTYINFDNPSVKKALDSLMQSGPNLLKSLSSANTSTTQVMPDNVPNKSAGGHQRGPPNSAGEMGNMGPLGGSGMGSQGLQPGLGHSQGRNMGPMEHNIGPDNRNLGPPDRHMGPPDSRGMGPPDVRGMGAPDGRSMGVPDGRGMGAPDGRGMGAPDGRGMGAPDGRGMGLPDIRGMGPPDGRGMGPLDGRGMGPHDSRGMGMPQNHGMNPRQGSNMAPVPPGMGHRSGSPYQDRQGMYGGGSANMMNNRPQYMGGMGGGGHMGGQGIGGGPRRY